MILAAPSVLADSARLAALRDTGLLGTPAEEAFDRPARLAKRLLGASAAIVALIDEDRAFHKACTGWSGPRDVLVERTICRLAVESGEPVVIPDTRADDRVEELVAAHADLRAYLGVPLVTAAGHAIGTLCVHESQVRHWSDDDVATMRDLAAMVVTEIELRTEARRAHQVRLEQELTAEARIRDLTERHVAERALRESEAVYRTVVESLNEGLVITDLGGRALFINERMAQITGYESHELVGQVLEEVLIPETHRGGLAARIAARTEGRSERYEMPHVRRDGSTVWVEISGVPLVTAAGTIVGTVGTVTDISDRIRHERELVEARDAAEAASRAKSDFLARMSHELRTPLNSVIGFANVLARPDRDRSDHDLTYAGRIAANGRHLLELINDVLDISKVEAGHLRVEREAVDLAALVRETLQEIEGRASESPATLVASIPDGVLPLSTDPSRLKQVLINLVGNALKFTPRGEVRVTVVACATTRRPLRIDIADTGIGIPEAAHDTIFDAFEQGDASTSRQYGGTGLGLSISRALCEALGHRITLESEEGRGSTFSVVFAD